MNLSVIRPEIRSLAHQRARAKDFMGVFYLAESHNYMHLFMDNQSEFRKRGCYEKLLLHAWSGQKYPTVPFQEPDGTIGEVSWNLFMKIFLSTANRSKLLKASNRLPSNLPASFPVYRGTLGEHPIADPRGVSWCLSREIAARFMKPCSFGRSLEGIGRLYQTTISHRGVYAYLNKKFRNEQEVLLVLPECHPVELIEEVKQEQAA